MKEFFWKLFLFSIPIVVIATPVGLSDVLWPIDAFTARALEAVNIYKVKARAPFIPNLDRVFEEYPDHMFYHPDAVIKLNRWVIDSYGYRNYPRPAPEEGYDIVITGASNVYGSYYDQDDLISEVLIRKCACKVYNMGFAGDKVVQVYKRFRKNPPREYIFVVRRGEFTSNLWNVPFNENRTKIVSPKPLRLAATAEEVWLSRLRKVPLLQYIRARLGTAGKGSSASQEKQVGPQREFDPLSLARHAYKLFSSYRTVFSRDGSDLLLYVHPTDDASDAFVRYLHQTDLPVVAVPWATHAVRGIMGSKNYWLEQDSHWRRATIDIVADLMIDHLASRDPFFSPTAIEKRQKSPAFQSWSNATPDRSDLAAR